MPIHEQHLPATDGIIEQRLTNAKFLAEVFGRLKQTPECDTRAEHENEFARLAARRQKWIEQYDADHITKAEFEQKMEGVVRAMREIEVTMPLAPPSLPDHRADDRGAGSDLQPLPHAAIARTVGTLKRTVRRLPVVDHSVTEVAVSGAYLREAAYTKPLQPSGEWCSRQNPARA
jgi:hypothetical protein